VPEVHNSTPQGGLGGKKLKATVKEGGEASVNQQLNQRPQRKPLFGKVRGDWRASKLPELEENMDLILRVVISCGHADVIQ